MGRRERLGNVRKAVCGCIKIGCRMRRRLGLIIVLLLQIHCVAAQSQNLATPQTEHRKTSKPYTGDLSIFDSPGRDERLQINRVMDILGLTAGKNVADIGAGSGWFTVRAAKRVGDTGTVYAVDINPEAIRYIDSRVRKENLHNVKPLLGKPDNPLLPTTVDAVLLLKTYHEVAQPITLLRNLRASLTAGAKVGVIDRNGNGENHGVARDIVIREANEAGYQLLEQYDFVKDGMDYFLVFSAK
jgi:SAM-dependent methyltransferase